MSQSSLETELAWQIKACGLPPPVPQYPFHPTRKWRADLAWVEHKLLLEVQGGNWVGGRHVTGTGFERDAEKFSAAAILGYRVLHVTGKHIESGQAVEWIRQALEVTDAPAAV